MLISKTLGWDVYCDGDGSVELYQFSPAGEDFGFTVSESNLIEDVKDYAESFDSEEHAAMWYDAKQRGIRCVPSLHELVEDADAIQEMLEDLSNQPVCISRERRKQNENQMGKSVR